MLLFPPVPHAPIGPWFIPDLMIQLMVLITEYHRTGYFAIQGHLSDFSAEAPCFSDFPGKFQKEKTILIPQNASASQGFGEKKEKKTTHPGQISVKASEK